MLPRKGFLKLFKEGCLREGGSSSSGSPGRGRLRVEEALGQKKSPQNASWPLLLASNTLLHLFFPGAHFLDLWTKWKTGYFLWFPSWLERSSLQREDYFKPALEIMFGFFTFWPYRSVAPNMQPVNSMPSSFRWKICHWLCGVMALFLP